MLANMKVNMKAR